jgi:hypothetical protein
MTVAILISGIRSRDRKSALALLKSLTSKMGVAVEILFLGAVVPEICLGLRRHCLTIFSILVASYPVYLRSQVKVKRR